MIHRTQPLLVVTDPRDDLGRVPHRVHVTSTGAVVPQDGLTRDTMDAALREGGVLVLARAPSAAAIRAVSLLCAQARETQQPAVVLQRDVTEAWPAHPATSVAQIPAALWADARAAWTSRLQMMGSFERRPFFPHAIGQLLHVVGDRRMTRFNAALHKLRELPPFHGLDAVLEGFVVLSACDGWHDSALDIVPGARTTSQAWLHLPSDHANGFHSFDAGADMLDDSRVRHMDSDSRDLQLASALTTIHAQRGDWQLLSSMVDALEPPPDDPNDTTTRSRARLLRVLLDELGHPPRWRIHEGTAADWHAEVRVACLPCPDPMTQRRVRAGLEPEGDGGLITLVACDAEADRLLPDPAWRAPDFQPPPDARTCERLLHQREAFFGPWPPEPAVQTPLVAVTSAGTVEPPFHIVRYGDRLPRKAPALLVLLGSKVAIMGISVNLAAVERCDVAMVGCPSDGAMLDSIPCFADARSLVARLRAFSRTRSDEVYPFDPLELGRVIAEAQHGTPRVIEVEIECPPAELEGVCADLTRVHKSGSTLALVHVEANEALLTQPMLVRARVALGEHTPCALFASPSNDPEMATITVWWRG